MSWKALCVALGSAAMVTAASAGGGISDGVIKIGILSDMSGVYADQNGPGTVVGAKMAIEEFGGKIDGHPIEIVTADHQNKPDVGSAIARAWYDRDGVDVIIGIPTSSVALAVQAVSRERKKPVIVAGAGSDRLTNEECSPYGMHWAWDLYAFASGTARAVGQTNPGSWFFISADYTFGHSLEATTTKILKEEGRNVVGSVRHPLNTQDFGSFLLQAQASKAAIISLANAGQDTINAIKQANDFGVIAGGQQLVPLFFDVSDVPALGLKAAQGIISTTGFYWDRTPTTREWSMRFQKIHGRMPAMNHASVYSATRQYLLAVKNTKTDDPDTVLKWIRENKINDVLAENGYVRADGRMIQDMYLTQVKSPAESKYEWDYFKILRTIPGEVAFRPLSQTACPYLMKK